MVLRYDVIIVGGGHAGVEAAWAASATGASVALVTLDPAKIGVMSCNPAIGGLAKGQVVREIDALGGLMGLAADGTGIMFKMLNTSKGPAVRGPRAQCDKHAYAEFVRNAMEQRPGVEIIAGSVERVLRRGGRIEGVEVAMRAAGDLRTVRAPAVVLTTGTFMRGLMHRGGQRTAGGRAGEAPAVGISAALNEMGFELGRLKTGTPPRLRRGSIDWQSLDPQYGDDPPAPFSDLTDRDGDRFPVMRQTDCRITRTTPESHAAIRDNLHRAPMYNGQLDSTGPRYCPSIEDKIVRFADRDSHHVFLEPESHRDESIYCNGISTSLPNDIQDLIVGSMPGCENAEILRYGYAVEYDMVRPHQIDATCMTRALEGFFLAGQINGTTGYEEAAGQGLVAGLNAARFAAGLPLVTLGRDEAYIGVMLDDLVTKTPVEPYRMFTSRAEHRLLLRADNAADRLTPRAHDWGLACGARWTAYQRRSREIEELDRVVARARVGDKPLADVIRRPEFDIGSLVSVVGDRWSEGALATVHAERRYAGYIDRQRAEAKRHAEMERRRIPADLDISSISGLRAEAREALIRFQPSTFGQAARLEGVNPADLSLLLVAMKRRRAHPA